MASEKRKQTVAAAAQLLAEGRLTLTQIAERLNIDRRTLWVWKKNPAFQRMVDKRAAVIDAATLGAAITNRNRRIARLNETWHRLQDVIEARAADPSMAKVPGGTTGLLSHDVKSVGGGDSATIVDVYEVDTALLKELRETEKQAAIELGQWQEKNENKGDGDNVADAVQEDEEYDREQAGAGPDADPEVPR